MNRSLAFSYLLLLSVAALWGLAFAFQIEGMNHLGPYGFMAPRFTLATLGMLPLLLWWREDTAISRDARWLWFGGVGAGVLMFVASAFQQHGLQSTSAGNAGFITALYVVIVPLLARFAGFRPGWAVYAGAALATAGLYLLSFDGEVQLTQGDSLVLGSALFWALHMLWLGWVAPRTDVVRMSMLQFGVCALLSWFGALTGEPLTVEAIALSWRAIIYTGLIATSVCFTLQAAAQQHVAPSHVALILCLESVFAALGGWWLLGEHMVGRQLAGCGVMLMGILLAQQGNGVNPQEAAAHRDRGDP